MEVWRDISLMWLTLLTLVAVLPFAIVFFFAIKGMRRLRQLAKQYLPQAQEQARLVAAKTEEFSQQLTKPMVEVNVRTARLNMTARTILRRNRT